MGRGLGGRERALIKYNWPLGVYCVVRMSFLGFRQLCLFSHTFAQGVLGPQFAQ